MLQAGLPWGASPRQSHPVLRWWVPTMERGQPPPRGEEAVQLPAQSAVCQLQDHPSDHRTTGGGGAKQGLRPPLAFPIRALCHLALKQYKEAVRDCTEALRLDGKNVKAFYRRAQAYKALKVRKA